MKVDIIIPSNQHIEKCKNEIEEIKKTRRLEGQIIFTGLNASAAKNRNYGIKKATTDIVIMLDDDITGFYDGWDLDLVSTLTENNNIILASARLMKPDGAYGGMNGHPGDNKTHIVYSMRNETPSAAIAFYNTGILFDENFIGSGWEDTDFCKELIKNNPNKKVAVNNFCKLIHLNEMKNQTGEYWEKNKTYYEYKWLNKNLYPQITFTMTTCKRLNLFKQTINSFRDTCLDKDLITRWIISDDSSSEDEFNEMKRLCPEFEIYRSPKQGQPSSLNFLFNMVKTEWFFHCEDDWLFLKKDNYIRKMFDVSRADSKIKNIILRHWTGNILKTPNGIEYNVHSYKPGGGYKKMMEEDCEWYGYSLNPGLQYMPNIVNLEKYKEENYQSRDWDKPQAIKYMSLGLKRANLLGPYIKHIGDESVYNLRRSK